MKAILFHIGLSLSVLTTNCSNDNSNENNLINAKILSELKKKADKKPPLCLVLCDFTTSVDSISRDIICRNALMIMDHFYGSFALKYYTIDGNGFSVPFYENTPILLNGAKPSEKLILEKYKEVEKSNAKDSLMKVTADLSKHKKLNKSCMIESIERTIRDFESYDHSHSIPLKLIFLSDMLEHCNSSFGYINLEDQHYKRYIAIVEKAKSPALGFGIFNNIDIQIIISTNKKIKSDLHNTFWKAVFSKYGFEKLPNLSSTFFYH